ncbi:hypothetical protein H2789_03910 [Acinetobacter calcoaceticus]
MAPLQQWWQASWSVPNPGNLVDGDTVTATATDPTERPSLPSAQSQRVHPQHRLRWMTCW